MTDSPHDVGDIASPIVSLSLLNALQPDILARLLAPFEAALHALDIPLDHHRLDARGRQRLHRALNGGEQLVPAELQTLFLRLGDAATPSGHAQLRQLVQWRVGKWAVQMSPENLAAQTYLDRYELFDMADEGLGARQPLFFEKFVTTRPCRMEDLNCPQVLKRFEHAASLWLFRHGFYLASAPHLVARGDQVWLEVQRTSLPLTVDTLTESERPDRVSIVPVERDFLIWDRRTATLAVQAPLAIARSFYAQALGLVYCGSRRALMPSRLYTAEPLRGRHALGRHALPWIRDAHLTRVSMCTASSGAEITWSATAAATRLDDLRSLLHDHPIVTAFALRLDVHGLRPSISIEVRLPNALVLDGWRDIDLVRRYLREAGLMLTPPAAAKTE